MIDKLLLNNQILANKKKVQQSKVNIVNKLVQKLRKLKNLNEKKPDDKKILNKIRKTTEILACVKKTNRIEIIKKALLNDTNSQHIITNGRSTPEEISEALYFSNKNITEIVAHLKTLLNLNDTNPGWKEQIQELSKKKKKSLRTEVKKQRRQQRKERNELNKKRNEWLEQNLSKETVIENNEQEYNADSSKQQWSVIEVKKSESSKLKKEKIKKTESKIISDKTNEVKSIKTKEIETNLNVEEVRTKSVKAVDPFFITQSGDNYLSTAVIDRVQPEPPNDGLVRKERRAQGGIRRVRQPNRSKWNSGFTPNTSERVYKQKPLESRNSEKLHPSWAAKQKQNGIHEFKGSKITFGENSLDVASAVKKDNNELHPSWVAKQKIKPIITEFKGTKVVFDD